ncbi:MAG: hypothetical protein KKF26_05660, partial [Chloroflexi bacterium]|nr:hypothetical protein [Chloroflexota bacterium]
HIVPVSGDVYAIAYQGQGSGGFLKTVEIVTSADTSSAYEIVSAAGDNIIRAAIEIEGDNVTVASWQID